MLLSAPLKRGVIMLRVKYNVNLKNMSSRFTKPSKLLFILKSFYLFVFLFLLNSHHAFAQNTAEPYSVNDIFINASGKTPTLARNNAVDQAQREAFVILLGRLSIDAAFADNVSTDEINDMVHSQQITNEKIAGNNYSAIFNITFSEEFVKNALDNKKISKNDVKQETYLVFPVKVTLKKSLLWESDNNWKSAWEIILKDKSEPRVKVPTGGLDDIAAINSEIIENGNYDNFLTILNKYKADVAVIAFFNFDQIENKVNINLKTIRKFQNVQTKLGFVNVNQLEYSELLSKVAKKTIEHLNKPKDSTENNSKMTAGIDVLVSDLGDWIAVKSRLDNMNFIENMKINSISRDLVQISISYNKSSGDLISLFAKYNFNLQEKGEGQYFMSIR
jgi:Uncharacterized protein conserved in bacteria (DUF2066)